MTPAKIMNTKTTLNAEAPALPGLESYAPKGTLTKTGRIIKPGKSRKPKRYEHPIKTDEEFVATEKCTPENIHIFERYLRKHPARMTLAQLRLEERQRQDLAKYNKAMAEKRAAKQAELKAAA